MTCAKCEEPTVGKSKYCKAHRAESRAEWKKRIGAANDERKERYALFKSAWNAACLEGDERVRQHTCTPMVVEQHANPLDDDSPVTQRWVVADGACGFAWVSIKGNTSFAHWAKKHAGFAPAYGGGLQFWVHQFGQSYEKKSLWATTVARELREKLGVSVYAGGRLD